MARADSQFKPGNAGGPGRPKGLEKYARSLVGDDGKRLADFWLSVMDDPAVTFTVRLQASELLANRGFGRAPQTLEIGGEDGGPIKHEHTARLTLDDVRKLADALAVNGSS